MKAYTTIEESKQLIEAGLDVNTADMLHEQHNNAEPYVTIKPWTTKGKSIGAHILPCWSLAALIELLPDWFDYWDAEGIHHDCFMHMSKHSIKYTYCDCFRDVRIQLFEAFDKSLTSSVCKTIIWLLKNNYMKSNKNE